MSEYRRSQGEGDFFDSHMYITPRYGPLTQRQKILRPASVQVKSTHLL